MGGEERWRMITCADGGQDKSVINQIMLRYRPIAPKPATSGSGGDGLDSDPYMSRKKSMLLSKGRNKRKYVRIRKNNNRLKRNQGNISSSVDQEKSSSNRKSVVEDKVVTLQFLPEQSDCLKESAGIERSRCNHQVNINDNNNNNNTSVYSEEEAMGLKLKQPADEMKGKLESWVTVECVMDSSCSVDGGGGGGLGCTDMERVKNLEMDTCPGFISDGSGNVRWVNGAYRMMMMMMNKENTRNDEDDEEEGGGGGNNQVWLVTNEKLKPYVYCSGFTCWVRLQCVNKYRKSSGCLKLVPCDVWRMDCGGFAWRLDVEAALSLGR